MQQSKRTKKRKKREQLLKIVETSSAGEIEKRKSTLILFLISVELLNRNTIPLPLNERRRKKNVIKKKLRGGEDKAKVKNR